MNELRAHSSRTLLINDTPNLYTTRLGERASINLQSHTTSRDLTSEDNSPIHNAVQRPPHNSMYRYSSNIMTSSQNTLCNTNSSLPASLPNSRRWVLGGMEPNTAPTGPSPKDRSAPTSHPPITTISPTTWESGLLNDCWPHWGWIVGKGCQSNREEYHQCYSGPLGCDEAKVIIANYQEDFPPNDCWRAKLWAIAHCYPVYLELHL